MEVDDSEEPAPSRHQRDVKRVCEWVHKYGTGSNQIKSWAQKKESGQNVSPLLTKKLFAIDLSVEKEKWFLSMNCHWMWCIKHTPGQALCPGVSISMQPTPFLSLWS